MICAVEWKRSFNALNAKIGFMVGNLKYSIFLRNLCGQIVLILLLVGLRSGVWKTASILFSCIPGFFYNPRMLRPRVSSGQVCLEQNNHGAFISYIGATYRSIREICVSDLFSAPVHPVAMFLPANSLIEVSGLFIFI